MSSSLYWRPPPTNPDGESIGWNIKHALAKKLWPDTDGSLNTEWTTIGRDMISYLQGIAAVADGNTAEEASELIGLILKHGNVEVRIASN